MRELKYMPRRQIDNRPVRRRRSVRSIRRLTFVFLLGFAVVLGMLFSGWVRWKQREIVVRSNQLQERREEVLERRKDLMMERARLSAPSRISRIATEELGMVRIGGDDVVKVVEPADEDEQ